MYWLVVQVNPNITAIQQILQKLNPCGEILETDDNVWILLKAITLM